MLKRWEAHISGSCSNRSIQLARRSCCSWSTQAQHTAIAAHLNARRKIEWSENCMFWHTWEDQELQQAEGAIGPSCEVHSLIFACALVGLSRYLRQILQAGSMYMSMFVGQSKPMHTTSSGNYAWPTFTIRAWMGTAPPSASYSHL